ncbi:CPBP family intramembrane glutamic endopeptidase [Rubrobacter calidifluminis]|uniref:CPBP family intramembrane glutamic endopeptidase n=1 Tax=Rubrobacter calidifluminis TaxID=1392640 RepID=UPI002361FCE3|nr:CPBP family intramembrane glutamic endopeptidase [Rubrobacter calidifluminis]
MTAVSNLVAALMVGGLALWAQWARKSRAAEISLWILILALSFLTLLVGILLVAMSISGTAPEIVPGRLIHIETAGLLVAGVAGLCLCVPPLLKILGTSRGGRLSEPPVFFALWLFVMVLFTNNLVGILGFEQVTRLGTHSLGEEGRLSPAAVLGTELPFVVVAVCGVGLGVRRDVRQTLARLGYGRPTLRGLAAAALFVVLALLLAPVADHLFTALQPGLSRRVGHLSTNLFGAGGLGPLHAVLFALLLGIGAALGEETLFRGAVQPVLGIPLTSVLFASMHLEYGPSIILVYLFLISAGLGLLRRQANTTVSFTAHAAYNVLSVLIPYFLAGS